MQKFNSFGRKKKNRTKFNIEWLCSDIFNCIIVCSLVNSEAERVYFIKFNLIIDKKTKHDIALLKTPKSNSWKLELLFSAKSSMWPKTLFFSYPVSLLSSSTHMNKVYTFRTLILFCLLV